MKRYHKYRIKLKSGAEFQAQVPSESVDMFDAWINNVPNVSNVEEIYSVNKIGPHSSQSSKLAIERMNAGLTQQEMAEKLGVGTTTYQRWESKRFKPKTAALIAIGDILKVDWTTLIE